MSITREVTLWCDGTEQTTDGRTHQCGCYVLAQTADDARRKAKNESGWMVGLLGGKDYCDFCTRAIAWLVGVGVGRDVEGGDGAR